MKITTVDRSSDLSILEAMAINSRVLGRVSSAWKYPGLFASEEMNIIGNEFVRYYRKYGKAPRKKSLDVIAAWGERFPKLHEKFTAIERVLHRLELEKEVSGDYWIDSAMQVFSRIAEEKFNEQHRLALESSWETAASLRKEFTTVNLTPQQGVTLDEEDVWRSAFPEKSEALVTFRDGLGKFFGNLLERDTFFTFIGVEKRGKSFHLIDFAWRAIEQRRRVAYFEAGDMSQAQVMRRIAMRACGRPIGAKTIQVPTGLTASGYGAKDARVIGYEEKKFTGPLNGEMGYKAYQRMLEKIAKSRGNLFHLYCHPTGTLSVDMVRQQLDDDVADGWYPDCVVVDYADILAPPSGKLEARDKIAETWKHLRGLSLSHHVLLLTATQGNREAYDREIIRMTNISDDKRKLSYVNGAIGINMTGAEKVEGRRRLNWVCGRDVEHAWYQTVHCAGNLSIGNPCMYSAMPKKGSAGGEEF